MNEIYKLITKGAYLLIKDGSSPVNQENLVKQLKKEILLNF